MAGRRVLNEWSAKWKLPFSDCRAGCDVALGLDRVIEDGVAFCVELHEQVEIGEVAGEDCAAIPGRCEKDQRVVERFALLVLSVALQARQESGEDAGFAPSVAIWRENAMRGPQVDGRRNLCDHARGLRMPGVEQTGQGREFRFGHRGVPETRGA